MTTSRSWLVMAAAALGWFWGLNLAAGAEAVSKADRVNVRSRAGYTGEVITQVKKGQEVSVLETVTLRRPAAEEPPVWLKIELPPGSPVWVNDEFVDKATGTVKADMLNLRSGPTYDHAVVHRVKKGFTLSILEPAKDGWLKVSAPRGAVGYVPASLFSQGATRAAGATLPAASGSSSNTPAASASVPAAVAAAVPATAASNKPKTDVAVSAPPTSSVTATSAPPTTALVSATLPKEASSPAAPSANPPASTSSDAVRATGSTAKSPNAGAPQASQATAPSVPSTGGTNAVAATKTTGVSTASTTSTNNAWLEQFVRKAPPASETAAAAPVTTAPAAAPVVSSEVVTNDVAADPIAPVRRSRRSTRKEPAPTAEVAAAKAEALAVAAPSEPPPPEMAPGRWVRREGILVWPKNIVAPSHYALKTREGGRVINFVIVTQPGVPSLREYRGRVVILSGREYLDKRPVWRNIPLLDVESVEAVR